MIYLKEFNTAEEYAAFVESGQMIRPNVSLVNEPFTTYYNKYFTLGVFIQHVDGTLYTADEWSSNGLETKDANGVAVISNEAQFVIATIKLQSATLRWASDTKNLIDGVFTTNNSANAIQDYRGRKNTEAMLAADTSEAAYMCANYIFPNGQSGYLPSLGELYILNKHISEVNKALRSLGLSNVSFFWSSTQYNSTHAWWYNSSMDLAKYEDKSRDYSTAVLPFTEL